MSLLALVPASKLKYSVTDPRKISIAQGEVPILPAFGSFDLLLKLPENINLGTTQLHLTVETLPNATHIHNISVQEFRRPDFKAETALISKQKDYQNFGGFAIVKGIASYYAGGALPDSAGLRFCWKA